MTDAATATLSVDERYALLRSVGEECIQESELRNLVEKKPEIRCYDGFEPSGRMHIAQGIFKAINVNKCTTAGCEFVFWVADWFALMNDKVGGEMERIKIVGEYLIEVWKAGGMDMEKVVFRWSSEDITNSAPTYWRTVLDIARRNTVARIKKCCTIMGKNEGSLTAAQTLYPLMQCSDIFYLKADICQLGVDQRKVNMLAREYCDLIGRKLKPVILSHHMLSGLKQGQAKMSKSDPDSAVFMEDTAEDVERKIRNAYCPRFAQQANVINDDGAPVVTDEKNPVLDYYQCIIFARPGATITIDGVTYDSYAQLEEAFINESLSEDSLKAGLVAEINRQLDPVRRHFTENERAKALLEQVKSFRKGAEAEAPPAVEAAPQPESRPPHLCCYLPARIKLPLDTANCIVRSLNSFLANNEGARATLVLPDWTALAMDEVTGDEKDIQAALHFNAALLKAKGLSDDVQVILESDMILSKSNDFWVMVIHTARKIKLSDMEAALGELKNAGHIVAVLMRIAGAQFLKATHIQDLASEGGANRVQESADETVAHLPSSEGALTSLNRSDAAVSSLDDELFLDDNEMDIRRKIKKAYCAPEEAENPVTCAAAYIMHTGGSLIIKRGEEEVTYDSAEALKADCASGAVHPGDLKAAVTLAMVSAAADVQKALGTAEVKKLSQTLRNAEKKLAKKKK